MARYAPIHGMTELISIQRPNITAGVAGGTSRTYGPHLTNIIARVHVLSSSESVAYSKDTNTTIYSVMIQNPTAGVLPKDRIVWSSENVTMDILEINNLQHQGHTMSIVAQRVA